MPEVVFIFLEHFGNIDPSFPAPEFSHLVAKGREGGGVRGGGQKQLGYQSYRRQAKGGKLQITSNNWPISPTHSQLTCLNCFTQKLSFLTVCWLGGVKWCKGLENTYTAEKKLRKYIFLTVPSAHNIYDIFSAVPRVFIPINLLNTAQGNCLTPHTAAYML